MDRSDEQLANAESPRTEIWQPPSKVTIERPEQPEKQSLKTELIDEDIRTDFSFKRIGVNV
jgi:hypothetical protein